MTRTVLIIFWLVFATVLTRVQAQADGESAAMPWNVGAAVEVPLPQPKFADNGVRYMCGGVGENEAAYMERAARDYDLKLTFADSSGAYLADVGVEIKDRKGRQVLQTMCGAPMLLVDLPRAGNYRVRAEAEGYRLDKTVRVRAQGARERLTAAVLVWPEQVAQGPVFVQSGGGAGDGAGEAGAPR